MNEEEKKAIEILKDNIGILEGKLTIKYTNYNTVKAYNTILNFIKKLQKENEELKKFITEGITVAPHSTYKNYRLDFLRENFVSKKKIKDKIRKNEEIIDISNDGDLIHELYQENKVYEELLESEE